MASGMATGMASPMPSPHHRLLSRVEQSRVKCFSKPCRMIEASIGKKIAVQPDELPARRARAAEEAADRDACHARGIVTTAAQSLTIGAIVVCQSWREWLWSP